MLVPVMVVLVVVMILVFVDVAVYVMVEICRKDEQNGVVDGIKESDLMRRASTTHPEPCRASRGEVLTRGKIIRLKRTDDLSESCIFHLQLLSMKEMTDEVSL